MARVKSTSRQLTMSERAAFQMIGGQLTRQPGRVAKVNAAPRRWSIIRNGAVKKPRQTRPGMKALREIRRDQKSVELIIPNVPFQNVVRELAHKFMAGLRFQSTAILYLQRASEAYFIEVMEDGTSWAAHAKLITIMVKDVKLALRLRGERR